MPRMAASISLRSLILIDVIVLDVLVDLGEEAGLLPWQSGSIGLPPWALGPAASTPPASAAEKPNMAPVRERSACAIASTCGESPRWDHRRMMLTMKRCYGAPGRSMAARPPAGMLRPRMRPCAESMDRARRPAHRRRALSVTRGAELRQQIIERQRLGDGKSLPVIDAEGGDARADLLGLHVLRDVSRATWCARAARWRGPSIRRAGRG